MRPPTLQHVGLGHRRLGLGNLPAPLADHRKLRERKRVVRFEFAYLLGMGDRLVIAAEFLQHDSQGRVGQHMVRIEFQSRVQLVHRLGELSRSLEFGGFIVKVHRRRHVLTAP